MSTVDGHVERKRACSPVGAFPRARRDSRASGRPQQEVKIDKKIDFEKAGTAFFECMRLCCSEDHGAVRLRCAPARPSVTLTKRRSRRSWSAQKLIDGVL